MQINPAAHSLPVSLRYFDLVELSDLRDCLGVEHMDELLKVFAEALPLTFLDRRSRMMDRLKRLWPRKRWAGSDPRLLALTLRLAPLASPS